MILRPKTLVLTVGVLCVLALGAVVAFAPNTDELGKVTDKASDQAGPGPSEPEHPPEAETALIEHATVAWTGDYDGMRERGFVRILTAHSMLGYFLDGAQELGWVKEASDLFEEELNKDRAKGKPKLDVIIIPVARDQLIPKLIAGEGDLIAANLTITDARATLVDFSTPRLSGVREILITGPTVGPLDTLTDLVGQGGIHVRASSSYYESLQRLNGTLETPIPLTLADETLEDSDLLEMMDAGLVPAIIMDDHKARFWQQFFSNITLHPDMVVNEGGDIAWAMRKDSPKLKAKVDGFIKTIREGTLLGNILLNRYLTERDWIESPAGEDLRERFELTTPLFKAYADEYGFDWLLIAAQAFQESRIDQSKRSSAGALGVMQVLPSTAKDQRIQLPGIDDIDTNIHAGVKYLRMLRDDYFSGPEFSELDSALFALAAYNAGPANIEKARKRAEEMGLDPNLWFRNVELATARVVSREPVRYVRNIYKYYLAYRNITLVTASTE
jgi:membrane-bound lytic murein transglycosylase MltF